MPRGDYNEDYDRDYRRSYRDEDDYSSGGRRRGGERSASMQNRDEYGRFTGYDDDGGRGSRYESRGGYGRDISRGRGRGDGDITDSAGRHYTEDSWERAQEGRSLGGQHSHGGGRSRRGSRDENYGNGGSYSSRGYRSRDYDEDDYIDSAGRHYRGESWERAQEGRSRGGRH